MSARTLILKAGTGKVILTQNIELFEPKLNTKYSRTRLVRTPSGMKN